MPATVPDASPDQSPAPARPEPYEYFVSYAHERGFGHGFVTLRLPITSPDDVELTRKLLVDKNGFHLTIITFVLLRGPARRPS